MSKTVRCKMLCESVSSTASGLDEVQHSAKFSVAIGGSPENDEFFLNTPMGSLDLRIIKEQNFEVNKFYFVDITLAE